MQSKKIRFILVAVLVLVTSISVYANELNTRQSNLSNLQKEQSQIKNQRSEAQKVQRNVMTELQKIESQIEEIENKVNQLTGQIKTVERGITTTTRELNSAEENIGEKQDLFGSRLNVMYRRGNIGYAEVLLSSKSFPELLTNLDMVKKIVQHDIDLLKELQAQRDLIEDQKLKLEADKRQLITLRNSVKKQEDSLIVSRSAQRKMMSELQKDIAEYERQENELARLAKAEAERIRRLQSTAAYAGGEMAWPVPGYSRISSPYGNRTHPVLRTQRFHTGIDIPAPTGTPVIAANDGRIISAGDMGGYGRTVIVDHGGGIVTLYAHNSRLLVKVGDTVKRGDRIALIGSTGLSTGPHLHFEVRKDGQYVNPIPYVR